MSKIDELIKKYCPDGVEYKKLENVCNFKRGQTITKRDIVAGDVPVIAGGRTPAYYHNVYNRIGETITISSSGAYAGHINFWNTPIFCSDSFTVESKFDNILQKYLYYCLKNKQKKIYAKKKGSGIPHVYGKDLYNIKIPTPPLPVQEEIVRILDKFVELEAELEARKKQYEYYRNKLLTFDEIKGVK